MTEQTQPKRNMTEEKRQRILKLWNLGWSSYEISADVGLTRNSVIGAVYRLKQSGVKIDRQKKLPIKKKKRASEKLVVIPTKPIMSYGDPVDINSLRFMSCRFIVEDGDVVSTRYCNSMAWKQSYCEHHYKICYVKPRSGLDGLAKIK